MSLIAFCAKINHLLCARKVFPNVVLGHLGSPGPACPAGPVFCTCGQVNEVSEERSYLPAAPLRSARICEGNQQVGSAAGLFGIAKKLVQRALLPVNQVCMQWSGQKQRRVLCARRNDNASKCSASLYMYQQCCRLLRENKSVVSARTCCQPLPHSAGMQRPLVYAPTVSGSVRTHRGHSGCR